LPPAEAAYYRGLAPLIRAAGEEAAELVALGERRERNLLTIRAAQGRMEDRLRAVEQFAAGHTTPARFAVAMATFGEGATAIRQAMAEARAGFLHLDWTRVAQALTVMARGATTLDRAALLLDAAAMPAPGATPSGPAT
jgi:hypothetical protein